MIGTLGETDDRRLILGDYSFEHEPPDDPRKRKGYPDGPPPQRPVAVPGAPRPA